MGLVPCDLRFRTSVCRPSEDEVLWAYGLSTLCSLGTPSLFSVDFFFRTSVFRRLASRFQSHRDFNHKEFPLVPLSKKRYFPPISVEDKAREEQIRHWLVKR